MTSNIKKILIDNITEDQKIAYIATCKDLKHNFLKEIKEINNKTFIIDYIWQNFLIKLDKFVRTGDFLPEDICKYLNIKNYHINGDGTIDVHGDVYLKYRELKEMPLKFGNVSGRFNCDSNNLTNLIGSPRRVEDSFYCGENKNLTSLEGCPEYIGGFFWCLKNPNLWSFDHFPRHAKGVILRETPIQAIFNTFKDEYLADGGEFFSTSGTMMDFFWDMDPVYPNKVIIKWRLNKFLESLNKELTPKNIEEIESVGWKIK